MDFENTDCVRISPPSGRGSTKVRIQCAAFCIKSVDRVCHFETMTGSVRASLGAQCRIKEWAHNSKHAGVQDVYVLTWHPKC